MAEAALIRRIPVIVLPGRQDMLPQTCASCGARAASVCSALEDSDLSRLAALAVSVHVPAGRVFVEEGEPAVSFFNVTSGTVKLFKLLPDGRRQITGFADRGFFLGLAAGQRYGFSAEAVDEATLCRFSRARLRELLHDLPALEARLLQVASNELVLAQEQMLLLGRKTARERVASFLLARTALAACATPSDRVPLPMSRTDIADFLGLTIETVSRTLTRLRRERLIEVAPDHGLRILSRGRLQALASGAESAP